MRQHSPDLIEATWAVLGFAPVDFKEGWASGTFILPTRSTASWSKRRNGVGGIIRLYNPDRSGVLTMLIDAESKTHFELITIGNADILARSLTGPIVVTDGNSREVTTYTKAYIKTIPDVPKGVAAQVVPWQFEYENFIQQPFGFNRNVVGL